MIEAIDGGPRPYRSAAFASVRSFGHARFEAEIRAAPGPGLITGLFLHRDTPLQEIDIELPGSDPHRMLANLYFNPGDEGTAMGFGYRGSPCWIDLGFDASASFHLYAIDWRPGPRDCFVGWSPEIQFRRLRYVASNQRFCVLPGGRRPNAASAVMARTLRRLPADWAGVWGHPVLLVETFVDPARHVGTCYSASSFQWVGQSAGYGRRSGRYVAHGRVKDVYVKALHRRARQVLAGEFDHPLLFADPGSQVARIDFNTADLSSLRERLGQLADPRDPRGLRHGFAATLTLVACATLAGHKSMVAISEWCDAVSQQALARLDAWVSPGSRVAR